MNAYAHPRSHRERKVCPHVRARNAARPSPPRASKMVKHNTQKKTHKQKLNIHAWLVGSKYVACHATLRNEHETRTATTPTKVKGDHEA